MATALVIGVSVVRGVAGPVTIAAALLAIGLVVARDARPIATALCVAVAVAAGATELVPGVANIELTSWVFLLLAIVGLAGRWADRLETQAVTGSELAAVALVLIGATGLVTGAVDQAAMPGLLRMVQHVSILVAVASMPPTVRSLRLVSGGLLAGVGVQVLVGLAELGAGHTFFYSLWKPLEAATWQGFIRIGSTPADPNYLAIGLVATLPIMAALRGLWPGLPRLLVPIVGAAWLAVIAFTFSRAGYVGLLATPVVAALITRRGTTRRVALPVLVLAVIAGLLLIDPTAPFVSRLASASGLDADASFSMRLAGQQGAWLAFQAHPVLGLGFDQFVSRGPQFVFATSGIAVDEINALNSFLLVAAEAGLAGFVAFLVAIGLALRAQLRAAAYARNRLDCTALAGALEAIAVGLVVWSLLSLTLDGLHSPIQWVLLGACCLAGRWHARDTPRLGAR